MLRIENLTIIYKKTGQKIFNGLYFEIKKGEVLAILGPSGCGKTTLLNFLQGLITENDATITGSVNLESGTVVRTVFQESRLISWRNTIKNVSFGLEAMGASQEEIATKVKEVIKMVELEDSIELYPSELSVGMKQRVNFARAFVVKPDLLLLDEPFSALDSNTKNKIIRVFKKIINESKMTTIFVTHNVEEAEFLADKILKIGKNFNEIREKETAESTAKLFNDNLFELDE
jgi:NitT/TauT family transport system ATP-binding protein